MASKVVLVTGASGYLGQHLLVALSARRDLTLHGTFSGLDTFEVDFADQCTPHRVSMEDGAALGALLGRVRPDVVVHVAALSSPRVCEKDVDRCMAINAPSALIDHLPTHSSLVFLSTDQVYDGTSAPYAEATGATAPVNAYGKSKLAFEKALAARLPARHVSLRSSLIIGPPAPRRCNKPRSFLQDCEKLLSSAEGAAFFSNEMRSAVSVRMLTSRRGPAALNTHSLRRLRSQVDDVIAVIAWAIDGGTTAHPGVYNMGGPESLSRVDIALAVAKHRGLPRGRVHAQPRPADGPVRSPLDITMDSGRLHAVSGIRMRSLARTLPTAFARRSRWMSMSTAASMLAIGLLSCAVAIVAMSYAQRAGS